MGYITNFNGRIKLDRKLTPEQAAYLRKFAETRRMKRDARITAGRPDPIRHAVGLPTGIEGEFFVGADGSFGQEMRDAPGLLDANTPPQTQPGLWCQWTVSDDQQGIEWDEGEKFYAYAAWLSYIIENFLKPWGYTANGEIHWQGENSNDSGTILVVNNKITSFSGDSPLFDLAVAGHKIVGDWESYDRPSFDDLYEEDY